MYAWGLSAQSISIIYSLAPNTLPASSETESLEHACQEVWMMEIKNNLSSIVVYHSFEELYRISPGRFPEIAPAALSRSEKLVDVLISMEV